MNFGDNNSPYPAYLTLSSAPSPQEIMSYDFYTKEYCKHKSTFFTFKMDQQCLMYLISLCNRFLPKVEVSIFSKTSGSKVLENDDTDMQLMWTSKRTIAQNIISGEVFTQQRSHGNCLCLWYLGTNSSISKENDMEALPFPAIRTILSRFFCTRAPFLHFFQRRKCSTANISVIFYTMHFLNMAYYSKAIDFFEGFREPFSLFATLLFSTYLFDSLKFIYGSQKFRIFNYLRIFKYGFDLIHFQEFCSMLNIGNLTQN